MGRTTSIDVTKPGIDKAYGIRKLQDTLHVTVKEITCIGDALFPGGNDYPAEETGVMSIHVRGPEDTNMVITTILACLGNK
jgi:hydroxymethylpyrimidine pyrophosphatase-like HAD family hydrolase